MSDKKNLRSHRQNARQRNTGYRVVENDHDEMCRVHRELDRLFEEFKTSGKRKKEPSR